MNNRMS